MPNEITKTPAPDPGFINIPISKLHDLPDVPVPKPADKTLGGLVTGIMAKGVQEPIFVLKREDGEYEIIDGYRRRKAAEQAGLKNIPGKVVTESPERARVLFYRLHGLPEPKKAPAAPEKDGKAEKAVAPAEKSGEAPKPADPKSAPDGKAAEAKKAAPAEKSGEAAKPEEKKPDAKKAAAPAEKPGVYAEGPTGTTITKVLGERRNPPDEKARASLPLPGEGEAFAVTLHPAYLKKAEFNHFSVDRDSDDFKELFKSIEMNGVKDPVLARPGKDGTLEIISGQRRHLIASELNYPVPTIIQRMDDDDAHILVADGNLHRERISTYDQSRALRMKMDSMKHKAGRRKKGAAAVAKTDETLAAEMGISTAKLNRMYRVATATRDVCDLVDVGTIPLSVAYSLSFLKPANQDKVVDLINTNHKVTTERIERMKKTEKAGKLTSKAMLDIIEDKDIAPKVQPAPAAPTPVETQPTAPATPSMAPATSSIPASPDVAAPAAPASNVVPFSTVAAHNSAEGSAPAKPAEDDPFVGKQSRPEETKVVLRGDRLRKYFPDVNMTPLEIEDKVYLALDFYQKYQERQKQKDEIFKKSKSSPVK